MGPILLELNFQLSDLVNIFLINVMPADKLPFFESASDKFMDVSNDIKASAPSAPPYPSKN